MDTTLGAHSGGVWPERAAGHAGAAPLARPCRPTPCAACPTCPTSSSPCSCARPARSRAPSPRALAEQQAGEPFLPVFLTNHPDFTPLREQRLAFEYFPFELDDARTRTRAALGRLPRRPRWSSPCAAGACGRSCRCERRAASSAAPAAGRSPAGREPGRRGERSCSCPLAGARDTATLAALTPSTWPRAAWPMPPTARARQSRPARCRQRLLVAVAGRLARAHDPEAADAALAQAIDAGDAAIELRIARARLAEERGRTDLALRHWQRVLGLAADHLDGRLGMVRALRAEARFAEAERLGRELLAVAPKDGRPAAETRSVTRRSSWWSWATLISSATRPTSPTASSVSSVTRARSS